MQHSRQKQLENRESFEKCMISYLKTRNSFTLQTLTRYAGSLGLNLVSLKNDMAEKDTKDRIIADFQGGIRSAANCTPTLFINGQHYVGDRAPEPLLDYLKSTLMP